MRTQAERAAQALKVTLGGGEPFWGWEGRTLGRAGRTATGQRVWLRLAAAPVAKACGKLWDGAEAAQQAFGDLGGHRPALLAIHDAEHDGTVYRAELSEHLDQLVASADPILRHPLQLSADWWLALDGALEKVAAAVTDRVAVRQAYIDRAVPQYLGIPAPPVTRWATVHGDLNWANVTAPELRLLDWEAWGQGPWAYDQATLYAYSLLQSDTADRLREAFPFLGTTEAYAAEAVVCAELLQTVSRGSNLDLAGPLQEWADQLRDRA